MTSHEWRCVHEMHCRLENTDENDAQKEEWVRPTIIKKDSGRERSLETVLASSIENCFTSMNERIYCLERRKWTGDNFILTRSTFRVVHLQLNTRGLERVSNFFEDCRLFASRGQAKRVAPSVLVDGFDRMGIFKENKFGLETNKEFNPRDIFGFPKQEDKHEILKINFQRVTR